MLIRHEGSSRSIYEGFLEVEVQEPRRIHFQSLPLPCGCRRYQFLSLGVQPHVNGASLVANFHDWEGLLDRWSAEVESSNISLCAKTNLDIGLEKPFIQRFLNCAWIRESIEASRGENRTLLREASGGLVVGSVHLEELPPDCVSFSCSIGVNR